MSIHIGLSTGDRVGAGQAPRVLVLCQMFYPELISTGQVLTSLCEELRELGADVEVVCGPSTSKLRCREISRTRHTDP